MSHHLTRNTLKNRNLLISQRKREKGKEKEKTKELNNEGRSTRSINSTSL